MKAGKIKFLSLIVTKVEEINWNKLADAGKL